MYVGVYVFVAFATSSGRGLNGSGKSVCTACSHQQQHVCTYVHGRIPACPRICSKICKSCCRKSPSVHQGFTPSKVYLFKTNGTHLDRLRHQSRNAFCAQIRLVVLHQQQGIDAKHLLTRRELIASSKVGSTAPACSQAYSAAG